MANSTGKWSPDDHRRAMPGRAWRGRHGHQPAIPPRGPPRPGRLRAGDAPDRLARAADLSLVRIAAIRLCGRRVANQQHPWLDDARIRRTDLSHLSAGAGRGARASAGCRPEDEHQGAGRSRANLAPPVCAEGSAGDRRTRRPEWPGARGSGLARRDCRPDPDRFAGLWISGARPDAAARRDRLAFARRHCGDSGGLAGGARQDELAMGWSARRRRLRRGRRHRLPARSPARSRDAGTARRLDWIHGCAICAGTRIVRTVGIP